MRALADGDTAIWRKLSSGRSAAALMVGATALLVHLMTQTDLLMVAIIAPILVLLLPLPAGTPPDTNAATPRLPDVATLEAYLDKRLESDLSRRPAILALHAVPNNDHDRAATSEDTMAATDAMRSILRAEDMIHADRDGTVFVALSDDRSADDVHLIRWALRLQQRLRAPCVTDSGTVTFSTAIGVGPCDTGAVRNGARFCILEARRAMGEALRRGPDEVSLASDGGGDAPCDAVQMALDLDAALRGDKVVPYFQPQICTDTGRLVGVEALARWDHPLLGLLSPGRFMPTVGAAGAHRDLTRSILRQSLQRMREWDASGIAIPAVSINVTHADLNDPDFAAETAATILASGLAPVRVGIEVLETVLGSATDDRIERNLAELKSLGCQIDLDDFGTGQSSIASIRRFHIDRLKIDRSFVHGIDSDSDQQSMVAAIVTMAEQLKLNVLAEGVETPAEHARAAELGCGFVQGYGVGRPMPPEDLADWSADWTLGIDTLDTPWADTHRTDRTMHDVPHRAAPQTRSGKTA